MYDSSFHFLYFLFHSPCITPIYIYIYPIIPISPDTTPIIPVVLIFFSIIPFNLNIEWAQIHTAASQLNAWGGGERGGG